jgi:hypothetical protein
MKRKSVGSDFGSDRSARKSQIYDLRADLAVGKKPTSGFFSQISSRYTLRRSQSTTDTKYVFQEAPSIGPQT